VWGDGPGGADGAGREKEVRSPIPDEGFLSENLGQASVGGAVEMSDGKAWERPRAA
jgi:hypothetical protein